MLLFCILGTHFSKIWSEIHTFSFKKCLWKCRLRNGGNFSRSQCVNTTHILLAFMYAAWHATGNVLCVIFGNLFVWWHNGIFWFNQSIQSFTLWLTLELPNQDTGRSRLFKFVLKFLGATLCWAISRQNTIWSKLCKLWYIFFILS